MPPKPPKNYGGSIMTFFNSNRISSQSSQQSTGTDAIIPRGFPRTQPAPVSSAPTPPASQPSTVSEKHLWTFSGRSTQRAEANARLEEDLAEARAAAVAEGLEARLSSMNDAQRRAVLAPINQPLMVVAGAGTGKTFTVLQRLRYMVVHQGVHPSKILFISFTCKAAKEAKDRLEKMGLPGADRITVGTFHSFCFKLLQRHFEKLEFNKVPTILSEKKDLRDVMASVVRRLSVEQHKGQLAGFAEVPVLEASWQDVIDGLRSRYPGEYAVAAQQAVEWYTETSCMVKKKKKNKTEGEAKAKTNKKRGRVDESINKSPLKQAKLQFCPTKLPVDKEIRTVPEPNLVQRAALPATSAAPFMATATAEIVAAVLGDLENNSKAQEKAEHEWLAQLATDGNLEAMPSQLAAALKIHLLAQMIKKTDPIAYGNMPVVKPTKKNQRLPDPVAAHVLAAPRAKLLDMDLKIVETSKSRGDGLGELAPRDRAMHILYDEELRLRGAVDFNDLLLLARDLLTKRPSVAARVRERYHHILVDEFQDTNAVQMLIVGALVPPGEFHEPEQTRRATSLMVVGDGDQSIYAFRGAEPHVLQAFKTTYEHPQLRHRLELNYRSTSKVLDVAAATLIGNTDRDADERLIPTKSGPAADVVVNKLQRPNDEARWVVQQIEKHRAAGVSLEDVAVLFRAFKTSRGRTYTPITRALEARNIPYRIVRELNLLQRVEVKDILSYVDLLLDPSNDSALLRALNTPKRGLGDVTKQRLLALQDELEVDQGGGGHASEAQRKRPGFLECCRRLAASGDITPKARRSLKSFVDLIEVLRLEAMMLRPPEVLDRIVERSGYMQCLAELNAKREKKRQEEEGYGGDADDEEDVGEAAGDDVGDGSSSSDEDESDGLETEELGDEEQAALEFDLHCTLTGPLKRLIGEATRWVGERAEQLGLQVPGSEGQGDVGPPSLESLCYEALATTQGLEVLRAAIDAGGSRDGDSSSAVSTIALEVVASASACGFSALSDFKSFLQLGQSEVDFESATYTGLSSAECGVTISTIHAAKGLEWKAVFMPRFNLGFLPMVPRTEDGGSVFDEVDPLLAVENIEDKFKEHFEEERRLAHVGTTRAKDYLYYSYVARDDRGEEAEISPILQTVLEKCRNAIDDRREATDFGEDY